MHRTLRAHWRLTYAVAVAEDGVHYASIDSKYAFNRLMQAHGDSIIGHYTGSIDRDELLMDVLDEAHAVGII